MISSEISYLNVKNPDVEHRKATIKRIKQKNGYCPSKFDINQDTKCPCKDFKTNGNCECGLYLKIPVVEIME